MVTPRISIWFTDNLIVPDLSTLLNSCYYRLLQLRFHCNLEIIANFGTNAHKLKLYLLSFGLCLFSMEYSKNNHMKKIFQACVYLC